MITVRSVTFYLLLVLAAAGCAAPTEPPPPAPAAQPTATGLVVQQPLVVTSSTPTPVAVVRQPLVATQSDPTADTAIRQPIVVAPGQDTAGGGVLPAPLYLIDDGQVQRIDVDGLTRTRITSEVPARSTAAAVIDLAVSPADGSLAYVARTRDGVSLLRSDPAGNGRTVLIPPRVGEISALRWSPDGSQIAVRLSSSEELKGKPGSGVYLVPAAGGEPQLVQADDPPDPELPRHPRVYAPSAWSPNGRQLLLDGFLQFSRLCGLTIKDLGTGQLMDLEGPYDPSIPSCGEGVWSRDGATLYVNVMTIGASTTAPGLWRADPASGELTEVIPAGDGGSSTLVSAVHPGQDGSLYMFLVNTTQQPDPDFYNPPLRYTMYRAARDATTLTPLRGEQDTLRQALWSPRDDGAVVLRVAGSKRELVWLPASGAPAVTLPADGFDVSNLQWGR